MNDLLAAWDLFASSWLCTWVLAPSLALVGIGLVARGAVFQGVATAQASTAVIALMLVLGGSFPWLASFPALACAAMLVAVVASLAACMRPASEATNGVVFLGTAAATPLLLVHSPHGLAEVHRLMASSLVGAGWSETIVVAATLLAIIGLLCRHGRTVRLVVMDSRYAIDAGVPVRRWQAAIGLCTGVVLGLGLEIAGLLFVAGCLVLPTLVARQISRTVAGVCWLAPLVAVAAAVGGTFIAHVADLPLGQVVVALLAVAVLAARVVVQRT
jgi:ABC-type Mn2+/Zn2+ transport system permease subunit